MPSLSASAPGALNLAAIRVELPEYSMRAGTVRNQVQCVAWRAPSNQAARQDGDAQS
jgi:hypothetical protein